jgi:spore coat protein U-like protein
VNRTLETLQALGATGVALVCCFASGPLHADAACTFNSQALSFPPYHVFDVAPTDGIGTVTVNCTNLGTSAIANSVIALELGASSNGTASDRKMAALAGHTDRLRYGIYRDAARSQNWDQGGNALVQRTGSLQARETKTISFTLFGRIAPQQNVHAGNYLDSLVLTVTP